MKKQLLKISKKIDIYFVLLLALIYAFVCVLKLLDQQNVLSFVVMLNVMFCLIVISYFSKVLISLTISLIYVIAYGSGILYGSYVQGLSIPIYNYLWLGIIPISCIMVSFYRTYLFELQEKYNELANRAETVMGFDETTNLFNERMFHYDLTRNMAMCKRGYIPLCLIIIKLKYYRDVVNIIGESGLKELLLNIGTSISSVTRIEDTQCFIEDKGVFSVIAITNDDGAMIIKDRIRRNLKKTNVVGKSNIYTLNLDVKIGIAGYSEDIKDSLEFKERAEKNMEYDV